MDTETNPRKIEILQFLQRVDEEYDERLLREANEARQNGDYLGAERIDEVRYNLNINKGRRY